MVKRERESENGISSKLGEQVRVQRERERTLYMFELLVNSSTRSFSLSPSRITAWRSMVAAVGMADLRRFKEPSPSSATLQFNAHASLHLPLYFPLHLSPLTVFAGCSFLRAHATYFPNKHTHIREAHMYISV